MTIMYSVIPDKSLLPDPGVPPQVGGDTLHVEAVLVYQLNGPLLIVTIIKLPNTGQVLKDGLSSRLVFIIFFGFLCSL